MRPGYSIALLMERTYILGNNQEITVAITITLLLWSLVFDLVLLSPKDPVDSSHCGGESGTRKLK